MKKISNIRFGVQMLCLVLTAIGFFTSFEITMTIILIATLLAGAFYCGWVCPFGTIQESFSRIGRGLKIKKRKMPQAIHQYLIYVRYIVFVLVMFFSLDIVFQILSYDPRGNFGMLLKGNGLNIAALAVILSFAVIGVFFDRPFCNYFCYEGAKYGLLSSIRPVTIKRDTDKCVGCKKCDKTCPMNIEVSKTEQLGSTQCINCFQCVEACPIENTLTYGFISFNKNTRHRYVTVLLVAVIAASGYITYSNLTGEGLYTYLEENSSETVDVLATDVDTSGYTVGDAAGVADGVYTGSGEGFNGTVSVEITVVNEIITAIEITDFSDDESWFERAEASVPDDIIESQSTDVSAVSGATYSSNGIMSAVADALANAGATVSSDTQTVSETETVAESSDEQEAAPVEDTPVETESDEQVTPEANTTEAEPTEVTTEAEPAESTTETPAVTTETSSSYIDGVYTGSGDGFRGTTTVEVTVSNGVITAIEVLDYEDDTKWFERAEDSVVDDIIDAQSSDVSAVSGATYSSEGIMDAVADALSNAQ